MAVWRTVAGIAYGVALVGAIVASERFVSRDAKPERVTVTYWEKWTGDEGASMQKIVEWFNRDQDRIFVKYLSISNVDQKTLLATSGGNPPDVAGIWGEQVAQFADANTLLPLDDLAKEAGIRQDQYIPGYWRIVNYRDKLMALPTTPASTGIHVNIDQMPPEYRTRETFPKTFAEFDQMVDKVSKRSPDGRLELAGFLPSEPGWWNWGWGTLFGGELFQDGEFTIDDPKNIEAWEWVGSFGKRFGNREVQNFQSGFGNFSSPQNAWLTGKVATVLQGVWMANYIGLYNPKLRWFATEMPYPEDRPELRGRSFLGLDILVIPRGARHPKEAFEFLKFVQRQDVMEALCKMHGKNSPLVEVSEDFFRGHKNPFIRDFDRWARSPNGKIAYQVGIWPQLATEINNVTQEINLGQKSAEKALKDAQTRVSDLWRKYKRQVLEP